jgi:hypothetical protein
MEPKEICWWCELDLTCSVQEPVVGSFEHDNKPSDSIKVEVFLNIRATVCFPRMDLLPRLSQSVSQSVSQLVSYMLTHLEKKSETRQKWTQLRKMNVYDVKTYIDGLLMYLSIKEEETCEDQGLKCLRSR